MRSDVIVISQAFSKEIVRVQDENERLEEMVYKEKEYARYQIETMRSEYEKNLEKQVKSAMA